MSLPVFLADGQAVVRNGLKPWSEKSLVATGILPVRVHRLKTCATNGGGHGGSPHHLFMLYGWAQGP